MEVAVAMTLVREMNKCCFSDGDLSSLGITGSWISRNGKGWGDTGLD